MIFLFKVVNTEKMVDGSQRDLSFGLEIGDSKLWSALHTFTIEGEETPQDGDPSNVTATLLSDHTIYQGDGIVYFLTVKFPKGWVNLDVQFEGDGEKFFASNVRVVSQGTVAYIPSTWMVTSKEEGGKVKVCSIRRKFRIEIRKGPHFKCTICYIPRYYLVMLTIQWMKKQL